LGINQVKVERGVYPQPSFVIVTSSLNRWCYDITYVRAPHPKEHNKVYFGNTEDAPFRPGTYYWFSTDGYDSIYFGYDNNDHPWDGAVMGGMNEKGLCIDMNGLPSVGIIPETDKPPIGYIAENLMQTCATVEEAIAWCKNHNFGSSMAYQLHIADAEGDAVVVSAGEDRKVAYTEREENHYLVSTNWNLAYPENHYSYPCYRYNTAVGMLEEINSEENLTIQASTDIIAAVGSGPSYCYIFDTTNRDLYIFYPYYFRYEIHVKQNLHELLTNNPQKTLLSSLFPEIPTFSPPITIKVTLSSGIQNYFSIFLISVFVLMIYIRKRNRH